MTSIVAGLLNQLLDLDDDVALAARQPGPEGRAKAASIDHRRLQLVNNKIQAIKAAISSDGKRLLDDYLATMRTQITFVPHQQPSTVAKLTSEER